jgi:hypothetical protein
VQWQVAVSNANKKMSIGDTALNTEEAILNLLMNGSCCTFTKRMQVEKSAERRTHTAFIKSKGSKTHGAQLEFESRYSPATTGVDAESEHRVKPHTNAT